MTVANSREERGRVIGQLAGMSHGRLVSELEAWTIRADEIADEARELRQRRGESRTMLDLIAAELRTRNGRATSAPAAEAAA